MVNQLLTSMDGIEDTEGVVVLGATNRPDILDHALLRSGRFDRLLFIGPPDREARLSILAIHSSDMPLSGDIDLSDIADRTEGYTGADLEGICREAGLIALRSSISAKNVEQSHFEDAMKEVRPSVDESTLRAYRRMMEEWKGGIDKKEKTDKDLNYYG